MSHKGENPGANPPFLFWPVGQREFYLSLIYALLGPLAWGFGVFGPRAALVSLSYAAGALAAYALFRFVLQRPRGLSLHHSLVCALIAAGLAYPLLRWYLALVAGVVITVLIWLAGAALRQRLHTGLLAALLLTALYPAPQRWPLLARDRLFRGDAAYSHRGAYNQWPRAAAIGGADAIRLPRPGPVLRTLYVRIAAHPTTAASRRLLRRTVALYLPSPWHLLLGAVPGRVGTVGLLAIIAAGLVLCYRHVLKAGAWLLFLLGTLAGLIFGPLSGPEWSHGFWQSVGGIWYLPPAQAGTLLFMELGSADFLFASVFVLALPGTLPLEPMARRIFLVLAGVGAAVLHRLNIPVPPATLALLIMQPLGPTLDAALHRRPWALGW